MSTNGRDPGSDSRQRRIAAWLLCGSLAAGAIPSHALTDDRDQPIFIQSDRAERDERIGTTVYTGNVEIDQGSLHISAERVTVRDAADAVTEIVASGKPAKMHQKPAPDREPVYARALTIHYKVDEEVLTLSDEASVTQHEGATVNGDQIVYYVQEQRVVATGGRTATGEGQGPVRVVIPPRRKPATNGAASNEPAGGAGPR